MNCAQLSVCLRLSFRKANGGLGSTVCAKLPRPSARALTATTCRCRQGAQTSTAPLLQALLDRLAIDAYVVQLAVDPEGRSRLRLQQQFPQARAHTLSRNARLTMPGSSGAVRARRVLGLRQQRRWASKEVIK